LSVRERSMRIGGGAAMLAASETWRGMVEQP